jgi:ribosomal protein S18 acetylase RimI-like enzyme
MLYPASPADTPNIVALAVAAGMFLPHEVQPLEQVLDDFHSGRLGTENRLELWADQARTAPVGVVYFGPNAMSDRTWELWMIAVAPDRQRHGIGGQLITFTEAHIKSAGGRLLLIESSSLPKYDTTRLFYAKHGFTEVARIPDFYTDGDSKVTYLKRLLPHTTAV